MSQPMSTPGFFNEALRPSPARHLLLIEPDERFARLLDTFLAARGFQVARFADVRGALAALDEIAPGVIITDLDGEDLDGFALLEAVAVLDDRPPVLVFTRHAENEALVPDALRSLGVSVVLSRPCRLTTLEAVLEGLCELRHAAPAGARERRALVPEEAPLCQA